MTAHIREKHMPRAEYDTLSTGRPDEDAADVAHANRILADIARGSETLLTSEQADELLAAKVARGGRVKRRKQAHVIPGRE
jgi:hypothetical protein